MNGLTDLLRKPLAKFIERGILYGLAALFGVLGTTMPDGLLPGVPQTAEWLAALLLLGGAAGLDYWHHKKDRAYPHNG